MAEPQAVSHTELLSMTLGGAERGLGEAHPLGPPSPPAPAVRLPDSGLGARGPKGSNTPSHLGLLGKAGAVPPGLESLRAPGLPSPSQTQAAVPAVGHLHSPPPTRRQDSLMMKGPNSRTGCHRRGNQGPERGQDWPQINKGISSPSGSRGLPSFGTGPVRGRPEEGSLTRRGVPGPLTSFHACRLSSASFVWQWRHQPPPPAEWPCSAPAPAPSGAGRLPHGSCSGPAVSLFRGDTSSSCSGSRAGPPSATCGGLGRKGTVSLGCWAAPARDPAPVTPDLQVTQSQSDALDKVSAGRESCHSGRS